MRQKKIGLTEAIVSLVPGAQVVVIGEEITWIEPSEAPVTLEEITTELERLKAIEPIIPPDWKGFLTALKETTVFQNLKDAARIDVSANALATELRLALGEAALGLVDIETIQSLLEDLWVMITESEQESILTLSALYHIPLQSPSSSQEPEEDLTEPETPEEPEEDPETPEEPEVTPESTETPEEPEEDLTEPEESAEEPEEDPTDPETPEEPEEEPETPEEPEEDPIEPEEPEEL
jgi:hypothetical protein